VRAGELERLVADLCGSDPLRRDAASARLRVVGAPAIDRISTILRSDSAPTTRAAALTTLDGIDDRRVIAVAVRGLDDPDDRVRLAAITVLRSWITREPGTRVLEALTAMALDRQQSSELRLAALDALSELPAAIVQPVLEQAPDAAPPSRFDDPMMAQDWIARHDDAPLSHLHDAIVMLRDCERGEHATRARTLWRTARGAAHAALARRRSRVALYDLRESFDSAVEPLPLDFLTAMTAIGDGTCLEAIARAWASANSSETWWRGRLAETASEIVQRDKLTGRSAIVKRIRARCPGFL
jgi:hypothetical protein